MDQMTSAVRRELLEYLLVATAYGDALGASTEFLSFESAVEFTVAHRGKGYPWVAVGKGWLHLPAGAHTDDTDMTLAMARSYQEKGEKFDPMDVASRWVEWLNSNPPDVGSTIRHVLQRARGGTDPFQASEEAFFANPKNAANGALMRNGICAALGESREQAFLCSFLQSILTHYHPLSVLCCSVQTWLIRECFEERDPFTYHQDWLEVWHSEWTRWVVSAKHPRVLHWLDRVTQDGALDQAMETLCNAEFDPDRFNPFQLKLAPQQGYVLVSLQIAVWAMRWCRRPRAQFPCAFHPAFEPVSDVFQRRGLHTVGWLPLLGHDADTYAAIAAPMIVCAIGKPIPASKTENLAVLKEAWLFSE